MTPNTRRLCFSVGTGLLTASLSLAPAGCKKNTVNVAPPNEPHVNEGPEPAPDEPHVNEGPEAEPSEDAASEDADASAESPE